MAAVNAFKPASGANRVPEHAVVITPSDSVDLTNTTRSIWVGVAGNIKVDMMGGETAVTYSNVPVGRFVGAFTRVYSTGTTASSLIGEY